MGDSIDTVITEANVKSLTMPTDFAHALKEDSMSLKLDSCAYASIPVDTVKLTETGIEIQDNWKNGMEGSSLQNAVADKSGILTIIVVLFVSLSLNFKECKKLFTYFIEELRSNKKRANAFDEHSNHETRLTALTVMQYIVYGGIILFGIAVKSINGELTGSSFNFGDLMKVTGLFAGYYVFDTIGYAISGYTFSGKEGCKKWLRAFNASQSLAGAALMIPALIILFYPGSIHSMTVIACIIYVVPRGMFIAKWFSIFYKNIFSSVYFILYLCTMEIIPILYLYNIAKVVV
ncbi:MAG: DUF4271 domain-containing protein [Muribaculaceae bacterium]|nr:DUF4271 domain-containing protein [Muribaculaceae bacterium]